MTGDPCPECMAAGRLSEIDGLFKTYDDRLAAEAAGCSCGGDGVARSVAKAAVMLYQAQSWRGREMQRIEREHAEIVKRAQLQCTHTDGSKRLVYGDTCYVCGGRVARKDAQ